MKETGVEDFKVEQIIESFKKLSRGSQIQGFRYAGEYVDHVRTTYGDELSYEQFFKILFEVVSWCKSDTELFIPAFFERFNDQQIRNLARWIEEKREHNSVFFSAFLNDLYSHMEIRTGESYWFTKQQEEKILFEELKTQTLGYVDLICFLTVFKKEMPDWAKHLNRHYSVMSKEVFLSDEHIRFVRETQDVYKGRSFTKIMPEPYNIFRKLYSTAVKTETKEYEQLTGMGFSNREILYLNLSIMDKSRTVARNRLAIRYVEEFALKSYNVPYTDREKALFKICMDMNFKQSIEGYGSCGSYLRDMTNRFFPQTETHECTITSDSNWTFLLGELITPMEQYYSSSAIERLFVKDSLLWFNVFDPQFKNRWDMVPARGKISILSSWCKERPKDCYELAKTLEGFSESSDKLFESLPIHMFYYWRKAGLVGMPMHHLKNWKEYLMEQSDAFSIAELLSMLNQKLIPVNSILNKYSYSLGNFGKSSRVDRLSQLFDMILSKAVKSCDWEIRREWFEYVLEAVCLRVPEKYILFWESLFSMDQARRKMDDFKEPPFLSWFMSDEEIKEILTILCRHGFDMTVENNRELIMFWLGRDSEFARKADVSFRTEQERVNLERLIKFQKNMNETISKSIDRNGNLEGYYRFSYSFGNFDEAVVRMIYAQLIQQKGDESLRKGDIRNYVKSMLAKAETLKDDDILFQMADFLHENRTCIRAN